MNVLFAALFVLPIEKTLLFKMAEHSKKILKESKRYSEQLARVVKLGYEDKLKLADGLESGPM